MDSGLNESRDVLLKLRGVSVTAGDKALLSDIDLEVRAGESIVVLGANGAGKTTLLKLCNGIFAPSLGAVAAPPAVEQALIFQRPALLARSVLENVRFVLAVRGVTEPTRTHEARAALVACNLDSIAARQARLLSGGEQQRLALARAWALHPEVLFLDEPTASLDPRATREIESVIRAFDAAGTKIVMATHNLGQARRIGDEVLFVDEGRIAELSPIAEFFAQPKSPEAAAFIKGESPWA